MKKVAILNFSARKSGNCASVALEISRKHKRTNVSVLNISDLIEPCEGCNYECLRKELSCPKLTSNFSDLMSTICESEIVYYIIPNYCGAPCANYYAFNERTVGWFNGSRSVMDRYMRINKRFIIISNSQNEVFNEAMRQQTNETPKVLYLASCKYGKKSIDGDLMNSEAARQALTEFLATDDL